MADVTEEAKAIAEDNAAAEAKVVDGEIPIEADSELTREQLLSCVVDDLIAALVNARIHHSEHPRVRDSISRALEHAGTFLQREASHHLTLSVTKDFIVYDDRPLLNASFNASRLIQSLKRWGAGGIRIDGNATVPDLEALLISLNSSPNPGDDYEQCNSKLAMRAGSRVRMLPAYTAAEEKEIEEGGKNALCMVPIHAYQSVMELLEGITVSVSSGGRIDFDPVREHADVMLRRLEQQEGALVSLARQDQYDAFTFGHSVRVSVLALNFGRALTKNRDQLIRLGTAALLHDVGKARVPFEILHSNKPLTPEEREEISLHPEHGTEILLDHEKCDPHAISACFGHHCSQDERGYPKTVHEHEVSMVTDIVSIVDVFEALTAVRPYKQPMSPIRAYRIMMSMGDKFDPPLLRRFIEVNGIFPGDQLLELSTGELARVSEQTRDLRLPIVKIITDPDRNAVDPSEHQLLNLREQDGPNTVSIARAMRDDIESLVKY